jgi:hypothetical protein
VLYDGGKSALSRRVFVGRLAASTAALLAATAGRARASSARAASKLPDAGGAGGAQRWFAPAASQAMAGTQGDGRSPSAPPPWELLHPLTQGTTVAPGWRLAELSEVADGSCVVSLRNSSGRTYRVHICRNDGQPHGLVYTDRFDLVVMNGGQGDQRTDEGLAQTVAAVAHVLAANEDSPRHAAVLSALLPHAQRVQQFTGAATLL